MSLFKSLLQIILSILFRASNHQILYKSGSTELSFKAIQSFKNERLIIFYTGFPFVVWTEEMSSPEIRVQPPLCF